MIRMKNRQGNCIADYNLFLVISTFRVVGKIHDETDVNMDVYRHVLPRVLKYGAITHFSFQLI